MKQSNNLRHKIHYFVRSVYIRCITVHLKRTTNFLLMLYICEENNYCPPKVYISSVD